MPKIIKAFLKLAVDRDAKSYSKNIVLFLKASSQLK